MSRPTLAEISALGQKGADDPYALGRLYGSRLSRYLTWVLVRTPMSANAVTLVGVGLGVAAGVLLWIPLGPVHLLSVVGYQLSYILDFSDGEVARIRQTRSQAGSYFDWLGHFYVPVIGAGMVGLQLTRETGQTAWFLLAIISMLGLSAYHFSCKEHVVIAYLRTHPEQVNSEAIQNAMLDRPFGRAAETGLGGPRPRPGPTQLIGSFLIYPGAMHLLSVAIVADLLMIAFDGPSIVVRGVLMAAWTLAFAAHAVMAIRRNARALRLIDEIDP